MITTILVTGGRSFGCFFRDGKLIVVKPERNFIHDVLTAAAGYDEAGNPNPVRIVHGDCPSGADRIAQAWADRHMMPFKKFAADWDQFKKAAGPIRNQKMVDYLAGLEGPKYAIAFPGGSGTRDCVTRCDEAGIQTFIPVWD